MIPKYPSSLNESLCIQTACNLFHLSGTGGRYFLCTDSQTVPQDDRPKFQLFSAVCLQRPAVISAEKNALETEFEEMLHAIENENSLLSDHELRKIEDQ